MLRARLSRAVLLAALLAAGACIPVPPPQNEATPRVWPEPPASPRIAFVRAFSRPEHLGISGGFLERLAGLLFGARDTRLVRPMAVVAAGEVLYVADPGAHGVHRFDPAAGRYDLIQAQGGQPIAAPVALARGGSGEIYVADSAGAQVLVVRPGARAAVRLELHASLGRPTGIASDPAGGRLFVVDTAAHRVLVFDRDGALESSFGRRGTGEGEFNYPTLLWRDALGHLYVTDSLNFRVQVFDANGRFLRQFGRPGDGTGDAARQKGVATDRHGHIYVVDSLFHAFQIFDAEGRFLLAVGEQGHDRGEFWLPTGIFISENDAIYVADSYNRRVQVFRYIGGPT